MFLRQNYTLTLAQALWIPRISTHCLTKNLKNNVQEIKNALETISKITGVSFDWSENDKKSYGVIAQEIQKIIPELVEGEEVKTVNYSGIIPFLINSVKELDERVKKLENK